MRCCGFHWTQLRAVAVALAFLSAVSIGVLPSATGIGTGPSPSFSGGVYVFLTLVLFFGLMAYLRGLYLGTGDRFRRFQAWCMMWILLMVLLFGVCAAPAAGLAPATFATVGVLHFVSSETLLVLHYKFVDGIENAFGNDPV